MRDYLNDYPIDIYGREMYEKELDNRIKAGFQAGISLTHLKQQSEILSKSMRPHYDEYNCVFSMLRAHRIFEIEFFEMHDRHVMNPLKFMDQLCQACKCFPSYIGKYILAITDDR